MKNKQNKPPVVVIRRRGTGNTPGNQPTGVEISPLPPKIPAMLDKLDRAVMLLGSRAKGDLSPQAHKELEELIGVYPTLDQAKTWKQQLKSLRKEKLGSKLEKEEFNTPAKITVSSEAKQEEESGKAEIEPKEKLKKGKLPPSKHVPKLTPEQLAWVDSHWEAICHHESGLFPGTLLFELAKEQGFGLPCGKVQRFASVRLSALGEHIMQIHPEAVKRALVIWYAHNRRMLASTLAEQVGLTTLEMHGVLCRFGQENSPHKNIASEVERKREELKIQLVSLLYLASKKEGNNSMVIPGKLEFTIKINQLPDEVLTVADGWQKFQIACGEYEVSICIQPYVFKKIEQAKEKYPEWIAIINGKMGSITEKGFVLLDPQVQVFERKLKEKRIPSKPEQQSPSVSNESEKQNLSKAE